MDFSSNNFNSCLESKMFPDNLKPAKAVPANKKYHKNDKTNYRPISIFSNI